MPLPAKQPRGPLFTTCVKRRRNRSFYFKNRFLDTFRGFEKRNFPEYPPRVRQSGWDPALRVVKEGRPLIEWRRQEREDRSANGSSQIPSQCSPMGHSAEWEALWGSVRLKPAGFVRNRCLTTIYPRSVTSSVVVVDA